MTLEQNLGLSTHCKPHWGILKRVMEPGRYQQFSSAALSETACELAAWVSRAMSCWGTTAPWSCGPAWQRRGYGPAHKQHPLSISLPTRQGSTGSIYHKVASLEPVDRFTSLRSVSTSLAAATMQSSTVRELSSSLQLLGVPTLPKIRVSSSTNVPASSTFLAIWQVNKIVTMSGYCLSTRKIFQCSHHQHVLVRSIQKIHDSAKVDDQCKSAEYALKPSLCPELLNEAHHRKENNLLV